jgi:hypothetical protein
MKKKKITKHAKCVHEHVRPIEQKWPHLHAKSLKKKTGLLIFRKIKKT